MDPMRRNRLFEETANDRLCEKQRDDMFSSSLNSSRRHLRIPRRFAKREDSEKLDEREGGVDDIECSHQPPRLVVQDNSGPAANKSAVETSFGAQDGKRQKIVERASESRDGNMDADDDYQRNLSVLGICCSEDYQWFVCMKDQHGKECIFSYDYVRSKFPEQLCDYMLARSVCCGRRNHVKNDGTQMSESYATDRLVKQNMVQEILFLRSKLEVILAKIKQCIVRAATAAAGK